MDITAAKYTNVGSTSTLNSLIKTASAQFSGRWNAVTSRERVHPCGLKWAVGPWWRVLPSDEANRLLLRAHPVKFEQAGPHGLHRIE
jgi:hypothetical protein